jgi:hypothetical protein
MFARFAAVSVVVIALLGCDKATPTAPSAGLQPISAAGSIQSAPIVANIDNVSRDDRGDEKGAKSEGQRGGGRVFNVTFTKWVTEWPNMAGVVGGDVGNGTFAGEVLNFAPGTVTTRIEALYHINGSTHSFTAHNFVTQNEVARTAVVEGVIIDGWMKGRAVRGSYRIISCPEKTGGLCYMGALQIRQDSRR